MAGKPIQTFENHTRLLAPFHYVALPLLALNVIYTFYQTAAHFTWANLFGAALAIALALLCVLARVMALTVQDRVIRLEERLRMRALLPADLQPRINDFTVKQLVALRFAGDAELPGLARKVLDGHIEDQKVIKKMVTAWRPDHQRA
jgi:hypothetical protein